MSECLGQFRRSAQRAQHAPDWEQTCKPSIRVEMWVSQKRKRRCHSIAATLFAVADHTPHISDHPLLVLRCPLCNAMELLQKTTDNTYNALLLYENRSVPAQLDLCACSSEVHPLSSQNSLASLKATQMSTASTAMRPIVMHMERQFPERRITPLSRFCAARMRLCVPSTSSSSSSSRRACRSSSSFTVSAMCCARMQAREQPQISLTPSAWTDAQACACIHARDHNKLCYTCQQGARRTHTP